MAAGPGDREINVEWLPALLGGWAVYVIGALLAVSTVLIVWAFMQGRTIEFWPPKIGSKPDRDMLVGGQAPPPKDMNDKNPPAPQPPCMAGVTRVFEVSDARQFYQEIAVNYDQRNSGDLLATHMDVIVRIEGARKVKPRLRVLDLGGGTGQHVATHFFHDHQICWTYVDFCPGMVSQLQQHLAGQPLSRHLNVHLEDITRIHMLRLPAASYDVVLLNLVLSSMPQLPDFSRIAALVAPGGSLIVADINPAYTGTHPYYKATGADGGLAALRTRPVQPLEIITRAKKAQLHVGEIAEIESDEISYSFIVAFESPARVDRDHPNQEGRTLPT